MRHLKIGVLIKEPLGRKMAIYGMNTLQLLHHYQLYKQATTLYLSGRRSDNATIQANINNNESCDDSIGT